MKKMNASKVFDKQGNSYVQITCEDSEALSYVMGKLSRHSEGMISSQSQKEEKSVTFEFNGYQYMLRQTAKEIWNEWRGDGGTGTPINTLKFIRNLEEVFKQYGENLNLDEGNVNSLHQQSQTSLLTNSSSIFHSSTLSTPKPATETSPPSSKPSIGHPSNH